MLRYAIFLTLIALWGSEVGGQTVSAATDRGGLQMNEDQKVQLYWSLNPPAGKHKLGVWSDHLGDFDEVVGYTALGNVLLRSSKSKEYLVLYPQRSGNNAKNYGAFASFDEFQRMVLDDVSFVDYSLRPEDVSTLVERLGPLEESQVFFPVPFPCLGGSGELSTFNKGGFWIYIDLLGQSCL